MNHDARPFPDHQFDFGDVIFVLPLQAHGTVEGIVQDDNTWLYRVIGNDRWWRESQLAFAAPEGFTSESIPPQSEADCWSEN